MYISNRSSLDYLRERRDAIFDKMCWCANEDTKKNGRERTDYFVRQSLWDHRQFADANKLKNCQRGSYCGLIYCSTCRGRQGDKLLARFRGRIQGEGLDEDQVRDRFRWCTFLHAVVPADPTWVSEAIRNARGFYNAMSTKFDGSWAQGAFECELIDLVKVNDIRSDNENQERKRELVLKLSNRVTEDLFVEPDYTWEDADGNKRSDWVLVHTHFLMDVGNHEIDAIKGYLKQRFPLRRQAIMESIWGADKRSLDASLQKMASYPFKNRARYNYKFGHYDEIDLEIGPQANFNANEMVTLFNLYKVMCRGNNSGHLVSWGVKSSWVKR
jgi:hypothetical protein